MEEKDKLLQANKIMQAALKSHSPDLLAAQADPDHLSTHTFVPNLDLGIVAAFNGLSRSVSIP
jgi:hypothetical protein